MTTAERKAAILDALAGLPDHEALDALDSVKNLILVYSIASTFSGRGPRIVDDLLAAIETGETKPSPLANAMGKASERIRAASGVTG